MITGKIFVKPANLYDPVELGNISGTIIGRWEIIEDDEKETLRKTIESQKATGH